jgi:hypothetical protein
MIAIQVMDSKRIKSIYCHWDGYLQHNGSILNKHYQDSPKVNQLIANGDLSSLRPEIGVKHLFSSLEIKDKDERAAYEKSVEDMCTFYTRDRGEDAPFKSFANIKEAMDYYNGSWCEYFYLFKYTAQGEPRGWFYRTREDGRWKSVKTAMKKFKADEVA